MKMLVQRIYTNLIFAKVFEWGKLITIVGSAQILVQAISLISGILVIRLLPTHEYALYTLANTMLGTMSLLADGGISTGVMSQGGKVWQDHEKLGTVLVTGFDLRKKFAIICILIAFPILIYLLRHHGASWLMSLLIPVSLIPAFFTGLSNNLIQIPLKLQQNITPLQKNQVEVSLSRLAMLGLTIFVFPWTFVAILAAGAPQIWTNRRLFNVSSRYADWNQMPDIAIKKEILFVVKRILPGAVYYCLSSQITIWLISIFGSTAAVAQMGALSRLAIVLNLFSVLFGTLISPRFSRLPSNRELLLRRFLQIHFGLLLLCLFIISIVWLFPTEVLWILGKDYSNLTKELILSIVGSCLGLISGSAFTIYSNRGYAMNPVISIGISVAAIVCGIALIDVSSLRGIFLLNIFIGVVEVIKHVLYGFLQILMIDNITKASSKIQI
jgi:O-antigen/teichoic acid export membrane protein